METRILRKNSVMRFFCFRIQRNFVFLSLLKFRPSEYKKNYCRYARFRFSGMVLS
ncbi:hypothetical protein LEP1GSC168_1008 [Leptospira santarosai str. HAI134]|uniref:Uncharacterized protein n=2 Tax=Leptospira santarosai TaxID=28183 RepID=M6UQ65_9LEPT|nr:hypothetical protein LEP1GSC169_1015 [Leptospira santarosai str. HAI1349]EMO23249.1 hypothetical protein LEP1GSC168_1008 [Leptospira santarosai str. HAI134]EMO44916.1 hypothetical protein LEP1GSC187_2412 [Leptospira santarosai str. ZUN179]EMP81167.1 hypothetical protein LEP1GSC162_1679 [Leptospira santarosai str. CBC1531]